MGLEAFGNAVRGLRRITPNTLAAACNGSAFDGLPDGATEKDLLRVLHRGGRACGLCRHEIERLAYLVGHTLDIDWQEGGRPLVWLSVDRQAEELGLSRRRINQVERDLAEKGWVSHRDAADRRRRGARDPVTGRVTEAFGVSLAPLGARFEELANAAAAAADERARCEALRREVRALRVEARRLRAALGRPDDDGEAVALTGRMSASDLVGEVERLQALRDRLKAELAGSLGDDGHGETVRGGGDAPNWEGTKRLDGRNAGPAGATSSALAGEIGGSPIPIHTDSTVSYGGNQPAGPSGKALVESPDESVETAPDTAEADEGSGRGCGEAVRHDCGVEHLQPARIVGVVSQRLQELAGDDPGWRDLVRAVLVRLGELGIRHDTWIRAVRAMGARAAAVAVAVIDGRRLEKHTFVWCPDRFLAACAGIALKGDLHLHRSIWGLETRRQFREAWFVWDDVPAPVQGRLLRGESRRRVMADPS